MSTSSSQRAARKRDREYYKLLVTYNAIEAGDADHMFRDAETKAACLADLDARLVALINAEVDANPGEFKRYPDGRIGLRTDTVVPLRPRTP